MDYKKSDICNKNMNFQECELTILRSAIDESDKLNKKKIVNNDDIKKILKIVEDFIFKNKLMLYGGIAINNILPKHEQFYDFDLEIPDYDFYSPDALKHAKELTDIYYDNGYVEVEAKAGVHMGTYKVFVNFIPIADITQMHTKIYKTLFKDSLFISGLYYIPVNYLRMSMYLELSRPNGDVSRWEKVFKRLLLLNKNYPLKTEKECYKIDFHKNDKESSSEDKLYIETRENFISQGVVFFGGYATSLYSRYMSFKQKNYLQKFPDFDVLSEDSDKSAFILKEDLLRSGFKNIKIVKHKEIGEIIPYHNEVIVDGNSIAFIYKPIACHSYNKIIIQNKEINIATIDTILTFYLSFMYADMKYYDKDRMLCLVTSLFNLEEHNRLSQNGLLNRFSLNCYGEQKTLEDIRSEKTLKYRELSKNTNSKEYEMWFLKYSPHKLVEKNKKQNKDEIVEKDLQDNEDQIVEKDLQDNEDQIVEKDLKDNKDEIVEKDLQDNENQRDNEKGKKKKSKSKSKSKSKKKYTLEQSLIRKLKTKKNRKSGFLF